MVVDIEKAGVSVLCKVCNTESYEFDYSIKELIDIGDINENKLQDHFDSEGSLLFTCEECL